MDFFRPTALKRIFFFLLFDGIISFVTFYFAYLLRFNFDIPSRFIENLLIPFTLLLLLKVIALYSFKNYHMIWRFFSFTDAKNLFKAHLVAYTIFTIFYLLSSKFITPFPRSVILIDFFLSFFFLSSLRASKRFIIESSIDTSHKKAIIIGANQNTASLVKRSLSGYENYYIASIVAYEDETSAVGTFIQNIQVHSFNNIKNILESEHFDSAIIALNKPSQKTMQNIFEILKKSSVKEIKKFKNLSNAKEKLEDLSIEDLLARHPKDLDKKQIKNFIEGKSILITGAGGSIGSEISKQCELFGAKELILVDHSEYNLYQIAELLPKAKLKLLNITHKNSLKNIFNEYSIDIVIHAAAYKHVPICEANVDVAVENNVMGSKNIIDLAIEFDVNKVVIISTDKAVRPTNVMGCTKRISELYAQNVDSKNTEIVSVRFGNVLGSSGSVIPKFKKQIENGGPLTVTDPEITRYFMLIPEACQLVLQAASIAKGRELFVLDMGESVKIIDLAKKMIQLYDKESEIEIVFTGLRPGEKLYEELLLDENQKDTIFESIFIAPPTQYDIAKLEKDIEILLKTEEKVKQLKKIVPEFNQYKP